MFVLPTGIQQTLGRVVLAGTPDVLTELFTPGRTLEADVVSVFQGRAVLAFGRGVRLEAALQAPLQEGQRVVVQVQPREGAPQTQSTGNLPPGTPTPAGGQQPPPIVLKVLGPAPGEANAPQRPDRPDGPSAQPVARGEAEIPGQTIAVTKGALASARETAAAAAQQAGSPPAAAPNQPGTAQIFWLPIPLPDGTRGWAQLQVQEDDSPKSRARKGGPVHQVRIWWETPALGPVQVTMEASSSGGLATLFSSAAGEIRRRMEESLPDLQQRLVAAGFPEARVGCKAPTPGDPVLPAKLPGPSRLDRRM
ncbi:MAG TPA: flagellar hook-length control protein FliK [Symbiobacteriaceae bacterium]|jgi:hypothetical protein|nr:flagellar hook-length control protein FliK [Symbiobacteriaceae bacterium]